jgi:hypothetical protein
MHAAVHLGSQHDLVALRKVLERAADDFFAGAVRIDIGGSVDVLRARVAHVCVGLTRLAHDLAIGDLRAEETQAALTRSPLVTSYPDDLS